MLPPSLNSVRPELALLLNCGRARLDDEARERLRALLAAPLDWPETLRLAQKHGLIPLLHKHLREAAPEHAPPESAARLAKLSEDIARVNLHMTAEMLRIVKAMDAEGVTAAAIKGPALAQSLYGSIALRQFGDLDVLIRPADMSHAARVLRDLGYAHEYADPDADGGVHLRAFHEFSFASPGGVHVEVHHRLRIPCFQSERQIGEVLDRTIKTTIAGTAARVLSAEDQFVYLCVHGAKHMWERLEWVCAIAEILRGDAAGGDWERVALRARAGGDERVVSIGLLLAESLCGVPIPEALAPAARRDRTARALANLAQDRLIRDSPSPEPGEAFFYNLRSHGLRDRCVYCWFTLTTPSLADVAARPLPPRLHALYALSRPLRIIAAYAASVARAMLPRRRRECAARKRHET